MRMTERIATVGLNFETAQNFFPVITAQDKFRSVLQNNVVLPAEERLKLADAFDVNDCRTMNAKKVFRIKPLSNLTDGFS